MVIGSVGSSKTSLLNAILGEIPHVDGEFQVNGSLSYVAQESWIKNGMLRDNICFGFPYDEKKYKRYATRVQKIFAFEGNLTSFPFRVIKCAALEPDLAMMLAGDLTEIGDRGINLSGGQKQRVSLARVH